MIENNRVPKWIFKKTYYPMPTYEWNLPAGHSCPFAKDCKIKVDRETGKFDTIGKGYRCYAAIAERFPGVRNSRWNNFEYILFGGKLTLPKNAKFVRIHGSGDFYNEIYFLQWVELARENPKVLFWAFTKSLRFWVKHKDNLPKNLTMIASVGGHEDFLIKEHNLKYSYVVKSIEEAREMNLPIDNDDTLAMVGNYSFALLDNTKYTIEERKNLTKLHNENYQHIFNEINSLIDSYK